MIFIGIFFAVLLLLYIRGVFVSRKNIASAYAKLEANFGKTIKKDYSFQGKNHRKALLNRIKSNSYIDQITWDDLDMEGIYEKIDACQSAVGEEYLYYMLHDISANQTNIDDFEKLVSYIHNNSEVRKKLQISMNRLGYLKKLSPFDYLDFLTEQKLKSPVRDIIFDLLFIPAIAFSFFQPVWGMLIIFVLLVVNIFIYFSEKKELDGLLVSLAFLVRLSREGILLIDGKILASDYLDDENAVYLSNDAKKLLTRINRSGTYLVASGRNNTGASASSSPVELVLNYLNMVLHLDLIQYRIMLGNLSGQKDILENLIIFMGRLDAAVSVASYRESLRGKYCLPIFTEGKTKALKLTDGCHPLIEKAVPNSICADKGILLTGSNASGKSTFLRMVAINAIMAQSIHTVCAKEYIAPKYDIYSSIALKDNLLKGESYFIVEIKSLKRIMDASDGDRPLLCFVDEVLRGTNTVERICASKAILESLNQKNVLCFAATHDGELTELLKDDYCNYHFSEKAVDGDIEFSYMLQEGPATSRNALALLRSFGYPENIVFEAEKFAHKLDGQKP